MTQLARAMAIVMLSCLTLQAREKLDPLPEDGFISLETIIDDFDTSEAAALAKYNGMRICIHGRIGAIERAEDGKPLTVIMQSAEDSAPKVKAIFRADSIPGGGLPSAPNGAQVYDSDWSGTISAETSSITVDEEAAIRGTFDNIVAGEIILKNCFKLSPQALADKLAAGNQPTE
jgi:hypothetical protein